MPIETDPRPAIPRRPELTREALDALVSHDAGQGSRMPGKQWLADMLAWVKWADAYRERLAAWYVEHQAVDHDRKVDPADIGPEPLYFRTDEQCKVCAYLVEQYRQHNL